MAIELPDLVGRVRIDTSDLNRLDNVVGTATKKGSLIGSALGSAVGGLAANGLAAAASKVGSFVSGSVDAFATLEDATGAAGVVFRKGLPDVVRFADGAAKSFGISKAGAIDAANTFGTLGKSAGLSGKDLAKFSTDFTGLAGDLASFKGTTPEESIQAIGSALRGESEPLRRFGVLMDDASLRNEALKQGLIANTSEALTPQNKVLAAQALIYAQTKDAQGDFQRTSESTANTQKRVAAETANVQAALGEKLAPALTAMRSGFLEVLQAVNDRVLPALGRFKDAIGPVIGPILKDFGAFFESTIVPALQRFAGFIQDRVVPVVGAVLRGALEGGRAAFETIKDAIDRNRGSFEQIAGVVRAFATGVSSNLPAIKAVAKTVFEGIGLAIGLAVDAIGTFLDVVRGIIRIVGPPINGMLGIVLTAFGGILRGAADVAGAFGFDGMERKLNNAAGKIDGFKQVVTSTLDKVIEAARRSGANTAAGFAAGLSNAAPQVQAAANKIGQVAAATMRESLDERSPSKVTEKIGEFAGKGFVNGLVGTEAEVTATVDKFAQRVKEGFEKVKTNVDEAVLKIVNGSKGKLLALAREAEATKAAFDQIAGATGSVDLTSLGSATAAETAEVKRLTDELSAARSAQSSAEGDEAKATAAATVATLEGNLAAAQAATETLTALDVTANLAARTVQAQQFQADIATLAKRGLSDQAIADLTARGAEAAGATARALVEGGQATVNEVNTLTANLSAAGIAVAKTGSEAFYDAGKQTAAGLARGFADQQEEIDKQMLKVARSMRRAIRKALGIKSPSTVFREIGSLTGDGMVQGLERSRPAIVRASRALLPVAPGTGAGGAGGSLSVAPGPLSGGLTVNTYGSNLTAADVAEEIMWKVRVAS